MFLYIIFLLHIYYINEFVFLKFIQLLTRGRQSNLLDKVQTILKRHKDYIISNHPITFTTLPFDLLPTLPYN